MKEYEKFIPKKHRFQYHLVFLISIFLLSMPIAIFIGAILRQGFYYLFDDGIKFFSLWFMIAGVFTVYYGYIVVLRKNIKLSALNMSILFFIPILTLFLCYGFMSLNIYLVPIAMTAIIIGIFVDKQTGLLSAFAVTVILILSSVIYFGYDEVNLLMQNTIALATCSLSSIAIVILIDKDCTRIKLIGYIVAVSVIMFVIAVFSAMGFTSDAGIIFLSGLFCMLGNLSALILSLAFVPIFEFGFKLPTFYRLAELCSFDQPLLKTLSKEAPGTFSHSLVVGNFAETCAFAIGENTSLAKACAYYHDVGKLINPEYFVENQTEGFNPHDELVPEMSAKMIIKHAKAGYDLIIKSRLPKIIADVALEHHGDLPVGYFYSKAQNITENEISTQEFRYPGPKPKSKIAAIIMIADTIEAASRTATFNNDEDIRNFVTALVKEKLDKGQFDECEITMSEIHTVQETIINLLPAYNHSRVTYPPKKENS